MVRDASSARSDQSERTRPKTEHHLQRLSRRIVAQTSAQSMERDDCDLRTEHCNKTQKHKDDDDELCLQLQFNSRTRVP